MSTSPDPSVSGNDMTLYFDMLEQAADGVVIIDQHNRVVFFNQTAERLWGYPASLVVGQNVNCLVPLEHRARHDGYIDRNRTTGINRIVGTSREVVFTRSNGDYVAAEMSISTALLGPERKRYYMAFLKGVTEDSHRRKLLEVQNQVFSLLSGDNTEQDIADLLCAEVERLVPNTVATLLQVTPEQALEILSGEGLPRRKIAALMRVTLTEADIEALRAHPGEARTIVWQGDRGAVPDAELLDCWASAIHNASDELIGIFALFSRNRDKITDWPQKIVSGCLPSCAAIIERGKTRERLSRLDRYDTLTGLLNRNSIASTLKDITADGADQPFALLVLDLDLFQDINNLMGYDQGDMLLRTVARRLSEQCRSNFVVGRLGGDDFVVIIPGGDQAIASTFAEKLTHAMREPVEVNGQELILSFSTGISLYPGDGIEVEQILNQAEFAMREAKKTARGSFQLRGAIANDDSKARVIIGSALRNAVQRSELKLYYQPQISSVTGALYGIEALARWRHPTLGFIPPSRFIPIAEETGQIEAIDCWAMEEACQQVAVWDRQGLAVPVVSVNISAARLDRDGLPETIAGLLERYALHPRRLTIEITEGVMMQQGTKAMEILRAIRGLGVGLALDDFGTGFSSLSRLASLPLTELKIDRSFVANLEREVSSLVVTEAAINIGKRIGFSIVTEGVEEVAQQETLRMMGCDVMPGFLFARPLPAVDFPQWVRAWPAPPPTGGPMG